MMGFWNKIKNLFKLKGFKSDEELERIAQDKIEEERKEVEHIVEASSVPDEKPEKVDYEDTDREEVESQVIPSKGRVEVSESVPDKTPLELQSQVETGDVQTSLQRHPTMQELQQKIDNEGLVSIRIGKPTSDVSSLSGVYRKLLGDKLNDPEVLQALIDTRSKLSHRFVTKFTLIDEMGDAGIVTVYGILPEFSEEIYNEFREGEEYDKSTFEEKMHSVVDRFIQEHGALNVKGGGVTMLREQVENIKLVDIEVDVNFA